MKLFNTVNPAFDFLIILGTLYYVELLLCMWDKTWDTCSEKAGLVSLCEQQTRWEALCNSELYQEGIYLPLMSFKATSVHERQKIFGNRAHWHQQARVKSFNGHKLDFIRRISMSKAVNV